MGRCVAGGAGLRVAVNISGRHLQHGGLLQDVAHALASSGLEAANLVATVRRGREKLHFLNPVPLQEIYERWIAKFEKTRLKALSDLKQRLEKANG